MHQPIDFVRGVLMLAKKSRMARRTCHACRAEDELQRVVDQYHAGEEGRVNADARLREMEAELESAKVEARRAVAILDQAADITRTKVESEWTMRLSRLQAEVEARISRLTIENQRLQQELQYRTEVLSGEVGEEHTATACVLVYQYMPANASGCGLPSGGGGTGAKIRRGVLAAGTVAWAGRAEQQGCERGEGRSHGKKEGARHHQCQTEQAHGDACCGRPVRRNAG